MPNLALGHRNYSVSAIWDNLAVPLQYLWWWEWALEGGY